MPKVLSALVAVIALPLTGLLCHEAKSATLVIGETALQKLIDSKFINGKIPIGRLDDCNNPYIESIHITIDAGRMRVAGQLSGQVGKKVAGYCVSATVPSNFTMSGVPAVSGAVIKLTDIKIESIEKKEVELPLGLLVRKLTEGVIQIDLKAITENALKNTAPYSVTLDSLQLQSIAIGQKQLTVNFDFKFSAQ